NTFENISFLDEKKQIKVIEDYSKDMCIPDIMYIRFGLNHDNFQGTRIQKKIDSIFIKKVKEKHNDKDFFGIYDSYTSRSILSIWHKQNPIELKQYLECALNNSNVISFLMMFPNILTSGGESFLDNFSSNEYSSLKTFVDQRKVFEIINISFPDVMKKYEKEKGKLGNKKKNKEDEYFLLQFLYWYYEAASTPNFKKE